MQENARCDAAVTITAVCISNMIRFVHMYSQMYSSSTHGWLHVARRLVTLQLLFLCLRGKASTVQNNQQQMHRYLRFRIAFLCDKMHPCHPKRGKRREKREGSLCGVT